ncbi:MAG TPA: TIGR01459 family HAD-type hydrolase [Parvularculaceae bacterium]|nr:TIGR01459 family HAD-type hydrolase [Parvularculaceae bacterium]
MQNPPFIEHLAEIAPRYDALFCDAWGVVHNGVKLFDGVEEALLRFRREQGPVVILTNAPRPSSIIPRQLDRLGLSREAYDSVATSGDATRAEIAARLPARAFRLGPDKDDALYEGLDARFAPIEEAGFIVCTGLFDERGETPDDYRPMLAGAAERGLAMICANPDIVVRLGERLIYCAGALAKVYEELGGEVVYAGKPYKPIYDLALAKVEEARGGPVAPSRVLAIGDGARTDIAGANARGFDAVFIAGAGGVHEGEEEAIGASLAKVGATAVAVMEKLQW